MHVLGIDVGGTKTICALADMEGRILATGRGDGANLQAVGEAALERVVRAVTLEALAGQGITPAAICLGIAGVDRTADQAAVRAVMARIGFAAHILIVNDALIALEAGVGDDPGIVIVSGTGSIAYGRNAGGHAARAGGWGHVLGDEGSGYWIGCRALAAVVREADGRGPATSMTPRVLGHFGIARAADLVPKVYHEHLTPKGIAALARYVHEARDEDDSLAGAILSEAADELVSAAGAVVTRLGLGGEAFTFVLSGGMFRALPWLRQRVIDRLPAVAQASRAELLTEEPVKGAVRLAIAELQGGAKVPTYQRDAE